MNGAGGRLTRTVTVVNERGLHARAASKLVQLARAYDARIEVARGETVVSGGSILGLMVLAAGPGTALELRSTGPAAAAALAAVAALIERGFDED